MIEKVSIKGRKIKKRAESSLKMESSDCDVIVLDIGAFTKLGSITEKAQVGSFKNWR